MGINDQLIDFQDQTQHWSVKAKTIKKSDSFDVTI